MAKLFHNPETSSETVIRDAENPHEPNIAKFIAMPIAPPPGTVLDTAVLDSVATTACR